MEITNQRVKIVEHYSIQDLPQGLVDGLKDEGFQFDFTQSVNEESRTWQCSYQGQWYVFRVNPGMTIFYIREYIDVDVETEWL